MKMKIRLILGMALVMLMAPVGAHAILIDSFNTDQSFTVAPDDTGFDFVDDTGDPYILGEERDVIATTTGGTANLQIEVDSSNSGTFAINAPTDLNWSVTMQWDGADSDDFLDYTGLGGVDLTDGGIDDRFGLYILGSDHPVNPPAGPAIQMQVFTSAAQWSSYTLASMPPVFGGAEREIEYGDFVAGAGGGADFTNVGAIVLTLGSSQYGGHDAQYDFFQTTHGTNPVPEPATMFLLGSGLIGCAVMGRKRKKVKKS